MLRAHFPLGEHLGLEPVENHVTQIGLFWQSGLLAQAFQELHRINPAVPIVLTSGYAEKDTAERFPEGGVAGFIQKPYQPQTLIDTMRSAMAR